MLKFYHVCVEGYLKVISILYDLNLENDVALSLHIFDLVCVQGRTKGGGRGQSPKEGGLGDGKKLDIMYIIYIYIYNVYRKKNLNQRTMQRMYIIYIHI